MTIGERISMREELAQVEQVRKARCFEICGLGFRPVIEINKEPQAGSLRYD
jgi:hypothetical protein